MNRKVLGLFLVVFVLLIIDHRAIAAYGLDNQNTIIIGHVYDNNLNLVDHTIVSINTTPEQKILTKNGTYSFSVQQGKYNIKVFFFDKQVYSENLSANSAGEFINDIIVFDNLSISTDVPRINDIFNDTNTTNVTYNIKSLANDVKNYQIFTIIIVAALLLIIVFVIVRFEKKRKSLDGLIEIQNKIIRKRNEISEIRQKKKQHKKKSIEDKIIDFLNEETITTQKDIKKKFLLSDTKVSLVISDLESKGIIQKIKKGRGNIVKLRQNGEEK